MDIRTLKTKLFSYTCFVLSFIAMIPLALIVFYLCREGLARMDFAFFTETQPAPGVSGGGVSNAIIGTLFLTTISTLIATPISILSAIYLAFSKKSKTTEMINLSISVLQSVPAIVVGLATYTWVVRSMGSFSMISGAIALAIMMIPYITVNTVEVIKLIPQTTIEAAYAMGGKFSLIVFRVIIPTILPGLVTGIIVALARVTGEAAPLFFTAFGNPFISLSPLEPSASLPLIIFQFSITPYENWQQLAWTASLTLLIFIVSLNLIAEYFSKNSKV